MRLTALCVCGTLLAFTSLFWTTADSDEGDLLWDNEFGPCTANLRPEGPCRHRQDESTCPYLFSLPPLTVHLPKQLRELEKIVEDLQKLKDNVDQLRKMCADCKVSQTERECGRQREHEKLNESADRRKDERNWLNETNGRLKDFRLQCGTDRVKAENTTKGDGDTHSEKTISEEKERKKWETERERSDKVTVKENEDEETLEMTEKDGKTQTEGAKEKDKFGQANDGNERIVDMVIKNVEKNNRERGTDRNKEKESKGNSKGDRGHVREKEKERKTTSNIKNKEKTEESTHHVWRDETKETEKKTQTEEDRHSDGIKMSEDHDGHTNQERRQYGEERKKEMEKGIKMERNNEKPKQTESIGHAEKEKTIKEGEVERDWESAMEIKTEGEKAVQTVQRDGDGELASSKATERTDFVSISPTPHSTISLAPRHDSMDSNKAVTFASPPSSSSLTPHLNTGVNQGRTIMPDRLPTQSTGLDAGGISEHPGPDAEAGFRTTSRPTTATINTLGGPGQLITSANTRFPSTTSARPETGFQGQISSTMETTTTTTPHQNLYTTKFPGVADRNRWTAKKNISSNTKTGVKPLPGRGLKPGEKHKPAIKPEADRRPKNPKNDHKPDRVPSPDSKTKHDQKQKPTHQKPTTNQKPKPGKDPKQIKNPKPDQRPENLPTDQNLKNTPKRDQEHTTDQNKLPIQKPKSNQKFTPPVQRPTSTSQTVNATKSHRDPQTNREITIIDQESKPDKKPVNPLKTDDPDQNLKNEEKTKHDQRSIVNQYFTPAQEPETMSVTPKPNQKPKTELIEDSDQNLSSKPKSIQDPPGQGHTPDQNQLPTQKPKSHEKSLLPVQRPTSTSKTANTTTSDKDPRTHRVSVERTIINQKPEKKPVPLKTENPDQKQKPPKKLTSEEKSKPDQRSSSNTPVQEPELETSSLTSKPNQKPKTELLEDSDLNLSPKPKSVQDPSPGQEHTPDQNQLPTQKPKSSLIKTSYQLKSQNLVKNLHFLSRNLLVLTKIH
ncbi:microtubule-associated protein futsch [Larimichthys crocea]|uniref:microtubule-associated protein futsch n=1 Tax=Larimichthys crocea TaxID=215358 RepID=UPI000F5FEA99|nr:microtubule-associated protein futsch [Larimichthys crocea]